MNIKGVFGSVCFLAILFVTFSNQSYAMWTSGMTCQSEITLSSETLTFTKAQVIDKGKEKFSELYRKHPALPGEKLLEKSESRLFKMGVEYLTYYDGRKVANISVNGEGLTITYIRTKCIQLGFPF